MDFWSYLSSSAPAVVPYLVLYVVGLVLAATQLRKRGRPATLVLIGCIILIAVILLRLPFMAWLMSSPAPDLGRYRLWQSLSTTVFTATNIVGLALILAAPFVSASRGPAHAESAASMPASGSQRASRATRLLVFAILGISVFGPLAIPAWIMGNRDLRAIRAGEMDATDKDTVAFARGLGMVGTILFIVGFVLLAIAIPLLLQQVGQALM